jgi:hypothetical protein
LEAKSQIARIWRLTTLATLKEKAPKLVWRLLVGGGIAFFAFQKVLPFLGQTLTVEPALYVALLAVSVSVVGGAFD